MWTRALGEQSAQFWVVNTGETNDVSQVAPNARLCFLSGMKAGTQNAGYGANACSAGPTAGGWLLDANNVGINVAGTVSTWCVFTCLY